MNVPILVVVSITLNSYFDYTMIYIYMYIYICKYCVANHNCDDC